MPIAGIQARPVPIWQHLWKSARRHPAKAACALANDQIHLTEDQKLRLFQRLVDALCDDKLQVRQIALKALQIQTGQTKSFDPAAPAQAREAALQEWTRWLDTYRSHL